MKAKRTNYQRLILLILLVGAMTSVNSFAASPFVCQDRAEDSETDETGIESGGLIGDSEVVCGPSTPSSINNISSPSGEIDGILFVKWESKVVGGLWSEIPGASTLNYEPGPISETTEYRRGCREYSLDSWIYSNVIVKTVTDPILDVKVDKRDVTCKSGNDGYGGAQIIGGTPGYTFSWSNGATTGSVFNFTAGTYTLTVTDQFGCSFTTSEFEIEEPETGVTPIETSNYQTLCPGSTDGALIVDAYYGTPPYTYSWSNGVTTPYNFDLAAGEYSVTVTDALGCSNELAGLVVTEPLDFKITANELPTSCHGSSDGSATIEVNGGTPPYFNIWEDGNLSLSRSDLSQGAYTVLILDQHGCFYSDEIEITEPTEIAVAPYVVNNIICKASINMVPSGGTAPYDMEWTTGETGGFLTNLCPGDYEIMITDANNCKRAETVSIIADYAIEVIKIEILLNPYQESGEIVIKLPYEESALVNIYNAAGQIVLFYTDLIPSDEKMIHLKLDLNKFSQGLYIIQVEQAGLTASEKIILAN